MPRRNRRRPQEPRTPTPPATTTPLEAPAGWNARRYQGHAAGPDYNCPRCHRPVARRSAHVVAWPTEGKNHRHWHTGCWESARGEGLNDYRWI